MFYIWVFYLCDELGLQFIIHPWLRNVLLVHRDSEIQYYEHLLSQEREVTGIHSLPVIKLHKLYLNFINLLNIILILTLFGICKVLPQCTTLCCVYIKKMNPYTDYGHYLIQFIEFWTCCVCSFIVDVGIVIVNATTPALVVIILCFCITGCRN